MATGEQIWAQCWSEPEAGSDLASLTSTARRDDERGGWVLNGQKTWSSRATYAHWGFGLFRSDPEAAAARRADLLPVPARRRRRHGAPDRPARRRGRLRRGLLRRRLRARRRRARRARRRLAGRDEHRRQRARPVAALPRPVLRRRRPAGRRSTASRRPDAAARPTTSSTPGSRRRPTGSTPGARSPGSPTAATWARPARSTRCSGPSSTSRCTRPRSTCSAPRPSSSRPGWTATCSRCPARSTPAPTRSSATSSPSGSSACPASRGGGAMRFELDRRPARLRGRRSSRCSPAADTVAVARAWADGDHEPGLKLWARLAEQGVTVLADRGARRSRSWSPSRRSAGTPCPARGSSPRPYLPVALGREVEGVATVAVPPHVPLRARRRRRRRGLRRHARSSPTVGALRTLGRPHPPALRGRRREPRRPATRRSTWPCSPPRPSCSAPASGCSPTRSTYVKQRKQFGREIGTYQAIKHALADVRIALDFARPLVFGAALGEVPAVGGQGGGRRRGLPRRPHRAAGARRDRLHRGVRPELWLTKIRALVDRVGHAAVPPRAAARGAGGLMEFAFSEEQQELAATVRVAARQARRQRRGRGPRWRPRPATTRRSGRRCASRSAWPRWRSPRSTTAPGSRCSSRCRARGGRPLARALAPARLAGHRRGAARRRRRRGQGSGCSRASPPARSRRSSSPDGPALVADQATVLVARRGRRPGRARPAVEPTEWLPSMDQTHPARRRSTSTGGTPIGDGDAARERAPSWSARSASPRSRPASRPGRSR